MTIMKIQLSALEGYYNVYWGWKMKAGEEN